MVSKRLASRRTWVLAAAATALSAWAALPAWANTWPSEPVRLVVASAAGGNADVVTRLLAPEIERRLGQPVVVENMPAASGMQGTEAVAKATNGHTFLVGTSSQLVFNMALFDPMPFDLAGGLRGVAMINKVPLVLLVNNDNPANAMRDYVEALKARPGQLAYGSGPSGTTTHITGLLWARTVGVNVRHVPYRAGSEGLRDLQAGRLSHQFDVAVTAIPQVQSRALKPLAVTGRQRLSALPEVPTVAELGHPDFTGYTWNSIAAPRNTPDAVVGRLNQVIAEVLQTPDIRQRLDGFGSEFGQPMAPAQVDAFYAEERRIWIPLVREASR
jgi:tripartite-type tricarboxylate transporter receptor subunit TctC